MTGTAAILAALAGVLHVGIFAAESFLWKRPAVWGAFGVADQGAADAATFFTFNQGFYNLFLGAGALLGSALLGAGVRTVGWTLLVYACASMVGAAIVLRVGGGTFYRRAAAVQAARPTAALAAALVVAVGS